MTQHIFMPGISLEQGYILPEHEAYLKQWREDAVRQADSGNVTASICHQATLIDLVLFGKPRHDWLGIMDQFLLDGDVPLAYSVGFGKKLHKFDEQYRQSTIHAIHTRWWIECLNNGESLDHSRFASLVLAKKQSDGLIYDQDVSETTLRHRMKSELTISMAMSVEILLSAKKLAGMDQARMATDISCPTKCPTLGYMSMEYFRLKVLQLLNQEALFPVGIDKHIETCAEGLSNGWCDFSIKSKVDAYMGTAKRTQRDMPIHSPLIASHVAALINKVQDETIKAECRRRYSAYACHLRKNPMDIPAFQMRDIPIHFGADRTPIEVICASFLITQCPANS